MILQTGGVFMNKVLVTLIINMGIAGLIYSQECAVKSVTGTAFLVRKGAQTPIETGNQVINEDLLRVGAGSVTINCPDKSMVVLKDNTEVRLRVRTNTPETVFNFLPISYPSRYWEITKGYVLARVSPSVEVKMNSLFSTKDAVITVKGTDLSITVNRGTEVSAIKGTVAGTDATRSMTFILPEGTKGGFSTEARGYFLVRSIKGDFSVNTRESMVSLETGESAYILVDRTTGRITCRVPRESAGGIVLTSGDLKSIVNPGQEIELDMAEKNQTEIKTGVENKEDIPAKVPFCGTRVFLKSGSMAMVMANPSARTVTVASHSGSVRVETADGRVVELDSGESFQDSCGIPVAEFVPPVEQPASPIKP